MDHKLKEEVEQTLETARRRLVELYDRAKSLGDQDSANAIAVLMAKYEEMLLTPPETRS